MYKRGFTLIELLTVVLVVAALVAMAVPMYDKAIERSHMAEARNMLKLMLESKLRTLDAMGVDHYGSSTVAYLHRFNPETDCPDDPNHLVVCFGQDRLVSQTHYTFAMHALDASLCCSTAGDLTTSKKHSCLGCADDEREDTKTNKQDGYTKSFKYSLAPVGSLPAQAAANLSQIYTASTAMDDAVCAARRGSGDFSGVHFLYLGPIVKDGPKLFCYDPDKPAGEDRCNQYGMNSVVDGDAWCGTIS